LLDYHGRVASVAVKLAVLAAALGLAACGSGSPHAAPGDASAAGDATVPGDAASVADAPSAADAAPATATDAPVATDVAATSTDAPVAADAADETGRCATGEARCAPSGRRQRCNAAGAWDEEEYVCTVALSGSSDYGVMCALKADGRLNCWAAGDWGNMQAASMVMEAPAARTWKQISVGDGAFEMCAVDTQGKAACWSFTHQTIPVPAGSYASLSFSDYGSCAISDSGIPTCFGGVTLPADFTGRFTHIVTANALVYGIDENGGLHAPSWTLAAYPPGKYVHLIANNGASCAIRDDGSLFCVPTETLSPPPSNADFTQVATTYGNDHGCAIRRDGTLACWLGNVSQAPLPPAPPGRYVHIAGAYSAICGIRTDGTTVCWNRPGVDPLVAPAGW
jgi:hypothetical protein